MEVDFPGAACYNNRKAVITTIRLYIEWATPIVQQMKNA